MAGFEYGPVELHLVGFEGDRPAPGVISAITDLMEAGIVHLLDFIIVSKAEDGTIEITEIEDDTDRYGFGEIELTEVGIAGTEDVEELAEMIPPGTSAALIAYEMSWAKKLASSFASTGGVLLRSERIPAPVVNALLETAQEQE